MLCRLDTDHCLARPDSVRHPSRVVVQHGGIHLASRIGGSGSVEDGLGRPLGLRRTKTWVSRWCVALLWTPFSLFFSAPLRR